VAFSHLASKLFCSSEVFVNYSQITPSGSKVLLSLIEKTYKSQENICTEWLDNILEAHY
jgi:hypothetical protein